MSYFGTLALTLFVYMNLWFGISVLKKKNDVADIAWGLGFVLLAWLSGFLSGSWDVRAVVVCALVSIWGIRLAWHIYQRNWGKPEDARYQQWREEWGKHVYVRSYLQVFMLQGVLLFIIALPVMLIQRGTGVPFGLLDVIGVLVWIVGFCFEAVADAQLAVFIKNPSNKGQLIQSGLWAYSRHPNYFGEVTQWWGIGILALSVPGSWIGLLGRLTITFLILKVSGVPMLEERMAKKPGFEEYKQRVSVFVPLPPNKQ